MTPGSNMTGLSATSNCTDTTIDVAHPSGYKTGQNGFQTAASIPSWNSFGLNLSAAPFGTAASPYPNTPLSMVGVVYSVDPPSTGFSLMMNQWSNPNGPQSTQSTVSIPAGGGYGAYDTNAPLPAGKAPGCLFHGGTITNSVSDFRWFPATDVYGSQLSPSLNPYKSVGAVDGRGHLTGVNWTNYHAGALNATDNAAYNARANTTYQPYIFTLGLGGNSAGAPPDHILMQRMANDPDADTFNSPALYTACSTEPGCVTYTGAGSGQLQGRYVYAPSSNQLAQAFLQISSQILRLSQ